MRRLWLLAGCGLLSLTGFTAVVHAQQSDADDNEVKLSTREVNRLDIFEDRVLSKADAAFGREEYDQAIAGYDAFVQKFPKSPALPYVLLRKGRCAQLGGKAADAVAPYKQVAEKYPKAAKYAVPALFHLAECHVAGGAADEAVKAWAKICDNEEYKKCPLVSAAAAKLVKALTKAGKADEAKKYAKLIVTVAKVPAKGAATGSGTGTAKVAAKDPGTEEAVEEPALEGVRENVRVKPDEAKLREVFKTSPAGANVADPEKSLVYWQWVCDAVNANGDFSWSERENRKTYYQYWAKVMDGKFPESDDFQIRLAGIHYAADRDREKWAQRLDELFKKNQKEGDWKRILKWVRAYKGNWTKTKEYASKPEFAAAGVEGISALMDVLCNEQKEHYLAKSAFRKFAEKASFEKMPNAEILKLAFLAMDVLEDRTSAATLMGKLKYGEMSEEDKLKLARKMLKIDGRIAQEVYANLKDKNAGRLELLQHFCEAGDLSGALPILDELAGEEKYAVEARQRKAELLHNAKRYTEAIEAYKLIENSPESLWKIVDCHLAMEDLEKAVEQLELIEKTCKADAPKAAYRIASLYREAEEKKKYILALRAVMDEYSGSPEAQKAEKEQEEMAIPPAMPEPPPGL